VLNSSEFYEQILAVDFSIKKEKQDKNQAVTESLVVDSKFRGLKLASPPLGRAVAKS
jgi:hypothetical protein